MFKKGMKVIRVLHGAGVTSEQESVVEKVNKEGVWVSNGLGNDPSGPFVDGKKEGMFGFWEEIRPTPRAADVKPRRGVKAKSRKASRG